MNALTVPNGVAVALFGIALSAAFCDIHWTKKNCIILAVGSAAMLLMQALITYMDSWTAMQETYPLITHLPLAIILSVLSGKLLWPTISVLAAYLCCQLRRWVALLVIAMVPGIDWLQPPSRLWSRCRCWRYCCAMLPRRPAALPGIRARCSFCSG